MMMLNRLISFVRAVVPRPVEQRCVSLALGLVGLLFSFPSPALSSVLTSDTTWSGEVSLEEDVLVPEGVTLTIRPGTKVRVSAAESTKTDPEYLSPLTEITVRGSLNAEGTKAEQILFFPAGDTKVSWAGIIVDGGKAALRSSVVSGAETGVSVFGGALSLNDTVLTGNRYGLTLLGPEAAVQLRAARVERNDYGVLLLNGATIDGKGSVIAGNRKKDSYTAAAKAHRLALREYRAGRSEKSRIYGDEVLLGTTLWQGRVEVNGMVRVPENARLVIMPGTTVEFSRKDTNHDGIGENGIQVQGVVIAKGAKENPIIFRSAEKQRRMGDWDSINIMNSDKAQNLIEYCQIEDAYRGLHFHFSNVTVASVVVRNNYRGIQFQESVVEITGTHFYGNKSAFQARDSEILFTDNVLSGNYTGMNLFRNVSTIRGNTIVDNLQEGMRVREGLPLVEGNLMDGNRHGLMVNDAVYGTFGRNVFTHNAESGISLRSTDSIEISGNVVQSNGINGINVQDSSASIQGNLISDNRERGIGVQSFQGTITGNTIVQNGLYNLGIEGTTDVSARLNWWGTGDVKSTIYDKDNDPGKGRADYLPMLTRPVQVAWPLRTVQRDAVWHGDIVVGERVTVDPGAVLSLSPGTRVLFSPAAGLHVRGMILARGAKNAVISFAAAQGKGPGEWDEILLDHAVGSVFSNCTFENATWALHSHFTDLKVQGCVFANNYGGIRFTSGPLDVRRSFFGRNEVGIRAFRGTALITENVITGNGTGIFVRDKGAGLTIRKNNLYSNSGYNVRMGDFNEEDVDARENWWGDPAPAEKIYDARNEPGIGMVRFEPYARKPFAVDLPHGMIDEMIDDKKGIQEK